MVISDEIKFPRPARLEPYRPEKKVEALDGVSPVARIGAFKREWNRRRGQHPGFRRPTVLSAEERQAVRRLVDQVNTSLDRQQVRIHLVLVKNEEGYSLDVYDCTGGDRCQVIRDLVIDVSDLPTLLRNLQEEAGLLVDTIS